MATLKQKMAKICEGELQKLLTKAQIGVRFPLNKAAALAALGGFDILRRIEARHLKMA